MPRRAAAEADRQAPLIMITLTVMLGLIMAIIDTSIVNVALSDMAGNLGSSIDEIGWVATGYILANVIVMPLNGWLTARFGRRNFYATCLVIFTVASFLCGTATNVWMLVFYRVIQGFGGGALQPTAQAILFESYPPEKRAGAMAIFGLGAMVGPAIGPTLGGVIVDNYSWPLIFYINIPIGIVAFLMTLRYIRDQSYVKRDTSPVDFVGLGLLTAGVASLQYVLERGPARGLVLVVDDRDPDRRRGGLAGGLRVGKELRDPRPLVDLTAFRSRSFSAGNVLGIITGFGLYGTALILPLFFQNVLGFSATQTGMALLPGAIATAVLDADRLAAHPAHRRAAGDRVRPGDLRRVGLVAGRDQPERRLLGRVLAARAAGLRAGVHVRAALDVHAGRHRAREDGQRDRPLHPAAPARRVARHRDPAAAPNPLPGHRVRLARGGVTSANPNIGTYMRDLHGSALALYQMVVVNATVISYDEVLRLCGVVFVLSIPLVLLLKRKRDDPAEGPTPAAALAE